MNRHTSTNYFDINQKKYVKIWLFGTGLNKGLEGHTAPHHIKHTLILNIGRAAQGSPIILNTPSY